MSDKPAVAAHAGQKLSELLYVELVGRAFLRADNTATIKPDPAQLAKLSLQLADLFHKVEADKIAESGPKNIGYDIKSADIGSWQK
jgi:hypothetical protein